MENGGDTHNKGHYSPSCFLSPPIPKLLLVVGRFHPRQLLHKLSGSELQLHKESSSNLSESSKLNRSHSSAFHSGWTTSCACSAAAAAALLLALAAAGCWFCWLFDCCCCDVIPDSICVKMSKSLSTGLQQHLRKLYDGSSIFLVTLFFSATHFSYTSIYFLFCCIWCKFYFTLNLVSWICEMLCWTEKKNARLFFYTILFISNKNNNKNSLSFKTFLRWIFLYYYAVVVECELRMMAREIYKKKTGFFSFFLFSLTSFPCTEFNWKTFSFLCCFTRFDSIRIFLLSQKWPKKIHTSAWMGAQNQNENTMKKKKRASTTSLCFEISNTFHVCKCNFSLSLSLFRFDARQRRWRAGEKKKTTEYFFLFQFMVSSSIILVICNYFSLFCSFLFTKLFFISSFFGFVVYTISLMTDSLLSSKKNPIESKNEKAHRSLTKRRINNKYKYGEWSFSLFDGKFFVCFFFFLLPSSSSSHSYVQYRWNCFDGDRQCIWFVRCLEFALQFQVYIHTNQCNTNGMRSKIGIFSMTIYFSIKFNHFICIKILFKFIFHWLFENIYKKNIKIEFSFLK